MVFIVDSILDNRKYSRFNPYNESKLFVPKTPNNIPTERKITDRFVESVFLPECKAIPVPFGPEQEGKPTATKEHKIYGTFAI